MQEICNVSAINFNLLAVDLDIYVFVHPLCKMWIFYEPNKTTLWNTKHFVEGKMGIVLHVSKNSVNIFVDKLYKIWCITPILYVGYTVATGWGT